MKYIIRNQNNEIFFKLNDTPANTFSGTYKWTCEHIQTGAVLTLVLEDQSTAPNNYQKFVVDSGDSNNFLLGQYEVQIYDLSASTTLIKTEYLTARDSDSNDDVYFMSNSETGWVYNTTNTSIPDVPVSLAANLYTATTVKLTWQKGSANTNAFDLWRKTGTGGTYMSLDTDVQSLSYYDTSLSTGTTYYYKIRGYNDYGYSSFTSEVSATTAATGSTGQSFVTLIGSGDTVCTETSENVWNVYTVASATSWGDIIGTLADQTDLQNALDAKLTSTLFSTYTGTTAPATYAPIDATDNMWTSGQTTTWVNSQGFLTGVTWNDVSGKPDLWTTGQTVSYINSQGFLTGITAAQITGVTDSLYLHADALAGYWTSGQTVSYVTGLGYSTFTGNTFVASGGTQLSLDGNQLTIYSPTGGTGGGGTWGSITGTLSGQTDLWNALGAKVDNSVYQADMLIISNQIDSNTASITGHTADIAYLSGQTDTKLTITDFNTFTGTTLPTNYYNESEVDGLISGFTTPTNFIQSGITQISTSGNDVTIFVPADSITGVTWSMITGAVSGSTTLQAALDAKVDNSIYNADMLIIGGEIDSNAAAITGKTDTSVFNIHTGDTAIHFEMSEITGFTTTTEFNTYTGTTAPATYAPINATDDMWTSGQTVSYIDSQGFLTGVTGYVTTGDFNTYTGDTAPYLVVSGFTASGGTVLDLIDGNLTIYAPTGGTSATWGLINGTLSGQTDLQDALDQKVDYPIYQDDLQIIGDKFDALDVYTGTTIPYYTGTTVPNLLSNYITGATNLGTGTTLASNTGQTIQIKSISVSGALQITGDSENLIIQTTSSGVWGSITGTLSDQTDLDDALDQKVDYPIYQDDLQTIAAGIDALSASKLDTSVFEAYTGSTDYISTDTFTGYTATTATLIDAKADLDATIVSVTGTTTIDATYAGKIIECDGTFTLTLPDSMDTGMRVDIVNVGTGTITLAASTTLQSDGTLLETQYTGAAAYHRGSDVWIAVGKLTTA